MQRRALQAHGGAQGSSIRGRTTHLAHTNDLEIGYFERMIKNREQQPGSIPAEDTDERSIRPIIFTKVVVAVEI
jgi:hypothetical protein